MQVTRRELFRLLAVSAAGTAVHQSMQGLAHALTAAANPPRLIWINEGGDDLNLLTLLGQQVPNFLELVALQWDVQAHPGLEPTGFSPGEREPRSPPILVMETLPAMDRLSGEEAADALAERLGEAKAAILVGTDACYGGIRASADDVRRLELLCRNSNTPLIKLPGVPTPPHHLVGVLAHLEYFGFPELDAHRRPLTYYGRTVCVTCERRVDLDAGRFARRFGDEGCLLHLGCKGLITHNSCSTARWNGGENWCVGAGGPCTGCSEPGFPDHGGLGLYGRLPDDARAARSLMWEHLQSFGYGLLGLAGAGVGLQVLRRVVFPPPEERPPGPGRGRDA